MNDVTPPKKPNIQPNPQPVDPVLAQESLQRDEPSAPVGPIALSEDPSLPTEKPSKKKWLAVVIGIISVIALMLAATYGWYQSQLSATDINSDEQVLVTLPLGSNVGSVSQLLFEKKLIRNADAFQLYVKLTGTSGKLQAGVYRIEKSADVPEIVNKLTTGKTDSFSITFLPGNTLSKHRQALIKAGYSEDDVDTALAAKYDHPLLASKPAEADLEGYIYGETYQMPSDATVSQILERTFDEYYAVVEQNNLVAKYKERNLTLHQGIILASIVQREVGSPAEDQAMIAGVFFNRLDAGMNLGSDVTYQYIADKTGVPRDPGLQSDYNTRIVTGLTPGPIASPGKSALLGVANPSQHEYLYFLSGDDDKTYFGVTDADHERNIREHCQEKCKIL